MIDPSHSLESLERKVDRLIALCDRFNTENVALRSENETLKAKIDTACERLASFMTKLPE